MFQDVQGAGSCCRKVQQSRSTTGQVRDDLCHDFLHHNVCAFTWKGTFHASAVSSEDYRKYMTAKSEFAVAQEDVRELHHRHENSSRLFIWNKHKYKHRLVRAANQRAEVLRNIISWKEEDVSLHRRRLCNHGDKQTRCIFACPALVLVSLLSVLFFNVRIWALFPPWASLSHGEASWGGERMKGNVVKALTSSWDESKPGDVSVRRRKFISIWSCEVLRFLHSCRDCVHWM